QQIVLISKARSEMGFCGEKRLLRISCLVLLAFFLSLLSHAQTTSGHINGVYRGTLGKQQIVLEMGAAGPHRNDHTCTYRDEYRVVNGVAKRVRAGCYAVEDHIRSIECDESSYAEKLQ